jgi:hypothetical protein
MCALEWCVAVFTGRLIAFLLQLQHTIAGVVFQLTATV